MIKQELIILNKENVLDTLIDLEEKAPQVLDGYHNGSAEDLEHVTLIEFFEDDKPLKSYKPERSYFSINPYRMKWKIKRN